MAQGREERPDDDAYYAARGDQFRQGDLFRDVPLAYPFPPEAADHEEGNRKFLAGPFTSGFGLLLTPTCSMAAQGASGYAHPTRVLAPVMPLAELVEEGAIKSGAVADLRRFDHLANYLYLPEIAECGMPESLALLYMPITLHHDYLVDRRIAQMSPQGAVHVKRQLTVHFGGELFSHEDFADDGDD